MDSDDAVDKEKVLVEPDSTKVEVKQEGDEESIRKRPGRRLKMKVTKKSKRQKTYSDLKEEEHLKTFLQIVPDEEGEVDYEVLDKRFLIINWEFDRMDLEELYNLVMQRFKTTSSEGVDLVFWGDLSTMFEETTDDDLWKNQEEWILKMQTASGKEFSNLLIAGSLPKTIWFSTHHASRVTNLVHTSVLNKLEQEKMRLKPYASVVGSLMYAQDKKTKKMTKSDQNRTKTGSERVKSIALKAKKESSDDETLTSEGDDEEYVMAIRNFKRDEKKGKSHQKCFRCGDQIISLAIIQNHLATKIKRPSLEVLGAIAKMTPKTKPTMKLVSWLNRRM
nr:hypothetical protein [Tanacetum cinerariifolium]